MRVNDVVDLAALPDDGLAIGGGKAVNLGRMLRAGLPVPEGFCVTTAAYGRVVAPAVADLVADLAGREGPDLDAAAARLRSAIVAVPLPEGLAAEITRAYAVLGPDVPVAVRSSATAEDLAEASFAGQQDTFLGVVGAAAVQDAVRRCWASLWTDRAVSYRATHGIAPAGLALAVVIERMVDARTAGVMFTANPLTGCRTETVIDAAYGLGESVVSGAVNPDRIVARTADGTITSQRLGDKALVIRQRAGGGVVREEAPTGAGTGDGAGAGAPDAGPAPATPPAALTGDEVRALVALGRRVGQLYGAPMDTEWAIGPDGAPWLTQARPITTLFPAPRPKPDLPGRRIYLNISLAQGIPRPMTTVGQSAFRHITSGIAAVAGYPVADPHEGGRSLEILADRLFADITTFFRHPLGRRFLLTFFAFMEARSAEVMTRLADEPEFAADRAVAARTLPHLARIVVAYRLPVTIARSARDPDRARQRVADIVAGAPALVAAAPDATAEQRLDAVEAGLGRALQTMPLAAGNFVPGFLGLGLARALLGDRARPGDLEVVMRGLPYNVTTTMDLELWDRSRQLLADPDGLAALRDQTAAELAARWRAGDLPTTLATQLARFLDTWGDRAVAELDVGMPRWRRDPIHILGVLQNYVDLPSGPTDPRALFTAAAAEGDAMVATLVDRCAAEPLRRRGVALGLDRARALAGLRESPKFALIRLLGAVSAQLDEIAAELVARGAIAEAADVVHLDLREIRRGLAGEPLQNLIARRRATYEAELARGHLPRILLSDGTEPETTLVRAPLPGELVGSPASSGVVRAPARVVLDPRGARLEPGEILVAPSTDPGWTPLFLTAGGLVMEMGGAMSHGAVVAREYGIPAVVGVPDAVRRIRTGQLITVDGAAGLVRLEQRAATQDAEAP